MSSKINEARKLIHGIKVWDEGSIRERDYQTLHRRTGRQRRELDRQQQHINSQNTVIAVQDDLISSLQAQLAQLDKPKATKSKAKSKNEAVAI